MIRAPRVRCVRSLHSRIPSALALVLAAAACGTPPPPTAPTGPAPMPKAAEPAPPPVDTSAVPEPPGLVLVGRITKPDALIAAAGSWTHLPLPTGVDLLRSITDEAIADVVDLSQPLDAAVAFTLSAHGIDPQIAFSVAVKSFDEARTKLGAQHMLTPGTNGEIRVGGVQHDGSKHHGRGPKGPRSEERERDEDDGPSCVLAHAPSSGARLVCGESTSAVAPLVPYLTRTVSREKWASDIHIEVHPEPVRGPLMMFRSSLPSAANAFLGASSPAMSELVNSGIGEVLDIVNDAQKLSIDADIKDSGIVANTRFDFQSNQSVFARMLTASDRAEATPAAFWHLPADTDTAIFGRGADPKLFEHPRELIAKVLLEATDASGMPETERQAVKDLVTGRMLTLFTNGPGLYAKGFDEAAVTKGMKAMQALKPGDSAGLSAAKDVVGVQMVGWHLYQVNEPVAKVGPVLKEWSALWNRPAFTKWAAAKASKSKLARMRLAPMPAGVTLPKDTVHLEVTIPRSDFQGGEPPVRPSARPPKPGMPPAPPAKGVPQAPILFHVFAVPDGGATWLAFGLDGKLVAQKAAASLSSAPDTNTLGKVGTGHEALREGKINAGGFATLRGALVFTALDRREKPMFSFLGGLADHGATPIVFTGRADAPSPATKGGSNSGQLRVPRALIEDVVKIIFGIQ